MHHRQGMDMRWWTCCFSVCLIMPARLERWEVISAGNPVWLIRSRAVSSDGRGENKEFRNKELGGMHVPIGGDDREICTPPPRQ